MVASDIDYSLKSSIQAHVWRPAMRGANQGCSDPDPFFFGRKEPDPDPQNSYENDKFFRICSENYQNVQQCLSLNLFNFRPLCTFPLSLRGIEMQSCPARGAEKRNNIDINVNVIYVIFLQSMQNINPYIAKYIILIASYQLIFPTRRKFYKKAPLAQCYLFKGQLPFCANCAKRALSTKRAFLSKGQSGRNDTAPLPHSRWGSDQGFHNKCPWKTLHLGSIQT